VDLAERKRGALLRHPWETARVVAVEGILGRLRLERPRVLDVGCGDGYLVGELARRLDFAEVVAQDIHLNDDLIRELSASRVTFVRDLAGMDYRADVVLLLDVLEHLEHPGALLREVVRDRLAPGGRVVITVPAFQRLLTSHDRALKHFRRYSRPQLLSEVRAAGLEPMDSGYLFASLLLPRSLAALWERMRGARDSGSDTRHGVGSWQGSAPLTRLTHLVLTLDNRLGLAVHERGLDVPGLSIWLTCKISS
jgi:SAM-dependent methyltransferase